MKVLFVGDDDNANVGRQTFHAATRIAEVRGFQTIRHPWGYPDQFTQDDTKLREWLEWADVIHFYNSICNKIPEIPGKPIVLQHGSELLRTHPSFLRKYQKHKRAHICETADLIRHLPAGERWHFMPPPINENLLSVPPRVQGQIPVIGHFPSIGAQHKGTAFWTQAVQQLPPNKFEFYCEVGEPIPWDRHMLRVQQCDIVLDQYSVERPTGKPDLGEPGVTTREAAALGIIPVVNSFNLYPYHAVYGDPPFFSVNSPEEIVITLLGLITAGKMSRQNIADCYRSRVQQNHSYDATAVRLLDIYTEVLRD